MVVPPDLVDPFLAVRSLVDAHPATIAQTALADFIEAGLLAAHVRRMRQLYVERQALLIELVGRQLGSALRLAPAAAGLHLVAGLAPELAEAALSRRIAAAGIVAPGLAESYQGRPDRAGLLLGYAGIGAIEMRRGVDMLARVVEAYRSAPSASPAA